MEDVEAHEVSNKKTAKKPIVEEPAENFFEKVSFSENKNKKPQH
jgi:hypothetical protein